MLALTGARAQRGGDLPLFNSVFLPPYRCWRGLFASFLIHAFLIVTLPALAGLLPDEEEAWRRQAFVVRPLELRVSDPFYYPAKSPPKSRSTPERARSREPAPRPARERKPEASKTQVKKAPRLRFELPALPRKVDVDQTVFQPQFPPDLPLQQQVRLPNIIIWGTQVPRLPRPPPRKFIEPGRQTAAPSVPVLDAVPRLELPNQERAVSDLKISGVPINEQPALPRPRGTTMPIRVFQAPARAQAEGVAIDPIPGEPVNLVAISSNPGPPANALIVPPGNQLGVLPGPPEEPGAGDASRGEPGAGQGQAASGDGPDRASAASDPGRGSGSGGRGPGSGTGDQSGTASGFGTGGSGRGGGQLLAISVPHLGLSAAVPVRVVHPNNAVFDVVVQSSSSEILPETTGLLSGKPVYTAYLSVGTRKDWILQYCRPAAAERSLRAAGNVVSLGASAPLKAPYPLVTVTPPVTLQPRSTYLMVHGLLDASGRFKALTLVREEDHKLRNEIIPFLEHWEFRPGTRDGIPVLLEILLVIPPNQA